MTLAMPSFVRPLPSLLLALCALVIAVALFTAGQHANAQETAADKNDRFTFDHFKTGFALEGVHAGLECESCHSRGIFKGTPTQCVACHMEGGPMNASAKPVHHINTTDVCEDCHNPTEWSFVPRVDHSQTLGSCGGCHNGFNTTGKPVNHIPVTNDCGDCHVTAEWATAFFDHSNVGDNCASCHNGAQATGKTPTHINTTPNCNQCHRTQNWQPYQVDHMEVNGTCASCHNGTQALGKPATHIPASSNCDSCHETTRWVPVPSARVDHAEVLGACLACHNGSQQTSAGLISHKGAGHLPATTNNCDSCHFNHPQMWAPVRVVDHDEITTQTCTLCHSSGSPLANTKKSANHILSVDDCSLCHNAQVNPGQSFIPARRPVNHTEGIFPITEDCVTCHNNTVVSGKPNNHINSTNNCQNCHASYPVWDVNPQMGVDHNDVLGTCSSCHNNVVARGQHPDHIPTPPGFECESCHAPNDGFRTIF